MKIKFENLAQANLIIDCIYEGRKPAKKNVGDEPLSKLMKCGNSGGFRVVLTTDKTKIAYIVLYTTMSELEWPDYLDEETGIFRYYGDNRTPGRDLHNTKKGGNEILRKVFSYLNTLETKKIPPFFVFKNTGEGRDMQFLGLAVPGNPKISPDKDLISFWRTLNNKRFQNYEAYFTILDTKSEHISRKWLDALKNDNENNILYAPTNWIKFQKEGKNGIVPLKSPKIYSCPSKYDQLQSDEEGNKCLNIIRNFYIDNPFGFEKCAVDLVMKMDSNFDSFSLTRPWRDGGRDAIGQYSIKSNCKTNYPLKIECALEAKCYNPNSPVGVKQMSRLISRIKYRQFGVIVTTSYVNSQAYSEVIDDGHPILILSACDIANILRSNNITSHNVYNWLKSLE